MLKDHLPIIYEDDVILICNKPSSLLSIKDGYDRSLPNAQEILSSNHDRLWIVHRLDKETSGLLMFAKKADAHRDLNMQFEIKTVHKKYHAITYGIPGWRSKEIALPLKINGDRSHRTVVASNGGKNAFTRLQYLSSNNLCTYLDVTVGSGYTHQIRSHLAYIGHPIINDRLYIDYSRRIVKSLNCQISDRKIPSFFGLHAYSLRFLHPVDKRIMDINIMDPEYFTTFVGSFINKDQ